MNNTLGSLQSFIPNLLQKNPKSSEDSIVTRPRTQQINPEQRSNTLKFKASSLLGII